MWINYYIIAKTAQTFKELKILFRLSFEADEGGLSSLSKQN
jgi:hypothetical protein